jgi:ribosome-associated protein
MHDERPSKTQRKNEMHDLQALGAELVALNERELASIELPERLLDAVNDARHMTKFEARRRQLQYIGKLMRDVDPEPIRKRLAAWKSVSRAHTARFQLLEAWRTRLLEEETALAELAREYPDIDTTRLQALVREAHSERQAGAPPRSYRAIFRFLSDTIPDNEAPRARERNQAGYTSHDDSQ